MDLQAHMDNYQSA
jgi:hypothetical protein